MDRTAVTVALGAAAISVVSTLALATGARGHSRQLGELDAAVARIGGRVAELDAARPGPGQEAGSAAAQRWQALEERLAVLETTARRRSAAPAPGGGGAGGAAEAGAPAEAGAAAADRGDGAGPGQHRRELESLIDAITAVDFDWQEGTRELGRFLELARSSPFVDERIAALEAAVQAAPGDSAARMELAGFYTAKLLTVSGPEQGLWGARAEEQWLAVHAQDPDHWESRFRIGTSYAYYPDVMGKTDDAIAMLGEALAIQQRQAPRPEHVQTYLSLARMHERRGDREKALAVLEDGLRFHPGDEQLQAARRGR